MITSLLNAFWPARCLSCEKTVTEPDFCTPCKGTLVPASDVSCSHCGNVFLDLPRRDPNYLCGNCIRTPPKYNQCRSAFAYGGALRDAIIGWKNNPKPTIGSVLGRLMVSQLDLYSWIDRTENTIVIPIPTSYLRSIKRGFNPAGQLANAISQELGIACHPKGLKLRKRLESSQGLTKRQRHGRTSQRFFATPFVSQKKVLLVDDVKTTGRTIEEASLALVKAGAKQVDVAVLAVVPNEN